MENELLKKNRLLIPIPNWYPNPDPSFQRIDGFYRTLPEWGWIPTLLTLKPPDSRMVSVDSCGDEVNRMIQLPYRIKPGSFFDTLERNITTHFFTKYRRYIRATHMVARFSRKQLRTSDFRAVWVSYPKMGSITIGNYLYRKTGIPWIADLRDLPDEIVTRRVPPYKLREMVLLKKMLPTAAMVVTISAGLAERLVEKYGLAAENVHVIPNGYNVWDFEHIPDINSSRTFDITYCGNLNYGRSPETVLRAVDHLMEQGHALENLRICLYGPITLEQVNAAHHRCSEKVVCFGKIPRDEVLTAEKKSAMLISLSCPGSKGIMSSKIFEYAYIGRPVLSVPEDHDVLDEFVKTSGAGLATASPDAAARFILEKYNEWKNEGILPIAPVDPEYLAGYDRRNCARRLAEIMNSCIVL